MMDAIDRVARVMAEAEGWRWGSDDGPTNMVNAAASGQPTSRSRDTWRGRAAIAVAAYEREDMKVRQAEVRAAGEELRARINRGVRQTENRFKL